MFRLLFEALFGGFLGALSHELIHYSLALYTNRENITLSLVKLETAWDMVPDRFDYLVTLGPALVGVVFLLALALRGDILLFEALFGIFLFNPLGDIRLLFTVHKQLRA